MSDCSSDMLDTEPSLCSCLVFLLNTRLHIEWLIDGAYAIFLRNESLVTIGWIIVVVVIIFICSQNNVVNFVTAFTVRFTTWVNLREWGAKREWWLWLVHASPGSVLVLSAKPLLTKHSTASLCKHTIRICRGMSRTVYK